MCLIGTDGAGPYGPTLRQGVRGADGLTAASFSPSGFTLTAHAAHSLRPDGHFRSRHLRQSYERPLSSARLSRRVGDGPALWRWRSSASPSLESSRG